MQLILMQFGAHSYATHVYFIHESMVSSFLLKKTYTKSLVYVLLSNIYASASFEDEVNSDNEKGRDFIAPSKYVHQECLDHWLSVKKGFAFACCTTYMDPYHLGVYVVAHSSPKQSQLVLNQFDFVAIFHKKMINRGNVRHAKILIKYYLRPIL
jgi:hypothetical protein